MGLKNARKALESDHDDSEISGLTPSQDRAIAALLECRSIVVAAQQAKVGARTLRRWLREDDQFQTKLRQLREEALGHASLRLQQSASLAVETLYDLLASKDRIETGRASLVRAALDFAFRSGAYSDLADRIAVLENGPGAEEDDERDREVRNRLTEENDLWKQDAPPKEAA